MFYFKKFYWYVVLLVSCCITRCFTTQTGDKAGLIKRNAEAIRTGGRASLLLALHVSDVLKATFVKGSCSEMWTDARHEQNKSHLFGSLEITKQYQMWGKSQQEEFYLHVRSDGRKQTERRLKLKSLGVHGTFGTKLKRVRKKSDFWDIK